MKAGPHPALAQGKVRYVGDHVAVVIAETLAQAKDAAEAIVGRLRRPAGGRRHRARRSRRGDARSTTSRPTTPSSTGISATRTRPTRPSRGAKHVTKIDLVNNRLVPNADGAARGRRRVRFRHRHLHALHDEPEPACGAARALGLHRHRAGAQAARHRAGCRRRLRLQDLHLCRGDGLRLGGEEGQAAGEVDVRTAPRPSCPTRMAATTSPTPSWRLDENGKILGLRVQTIANLGAYLSTFSSSVPTYLYAPLLSGQYDIPAIYCEVDAVYTNTAPVDAYRGAGRPEATFVVERLVEKAARELGQDPAEFRTQQLRQEVPAPDAGHHDLRRRRLRAPRSTRRWRSPTTRTSASASATAPAAASCAASASRAISRPAASRRRRRSARSAPASACGNRPRCASIRPAPSRC